MSDYKWRKSSRSSSNGDACVEVSTNVPDVVAVRDSKSPDGAVLEVSAANWRAFVAWLGRDGIDLTTVQPRPAKIN
jgi:hypothetical protein